ncbi:hypothetical protein WAI453_008649 [Rhynchosporium graminicola]
MKPQGTRAYERGDMEIPLVNPLSIVGIDGYSNTRIFSSSFAIRLCLRYYIQTKVSGTGLIAQTSGIRPALTDAVPRRPNTKSFSDFVVQPSPQIVKLLLEKGPDTSRLYGDRRTWQSALEHTRTIARAPLFTLRHRRLVVAVQFEDISRGNPLEIVNR